MAQPFTTSLVPAVTLPCPAPARVTCLVRPPRDAARRVAAPRAGLELRRARGTLLAEVVVGPALLAAWLATAVAFLAACW